VAFWEGGCAGIEIGAPELVAWMVEEGWDVLDGRSCGIGCRRRLFWERSWSAAGGRLGVRIPLARIPDMSEDFGSEFYDFVAG
jgi:hypothetical protein